MAVYDGVRMAQEGLLDVAKLCAQAVLKSPQITGRLKFRLEIVTGEDLEPILSALAALGKVDLFNMASAMCWTRAYYDGRAPVLLLIGANARHSDLNWNCGACGFRTCGEFNRFARENPPEPLLMGDGPTCHWLNIDYSAACCCACATAWHHNVTNRIEIASGMSARHIGYMPDCNYVLGLPLGPVEDLFWYSRTAFQDLVSYDLFMNNLVEVFPSHFAAFYGSGKNEIKWKDDWWNGPKHRGLEPPRDRAVLREIHDEVVEDLKKARKKKEERDAARSEAEPG
jgi:uncharacterized ferredoxin-like protein